MPRRCAFSIIELVVVLLILGILAGAAAPSYLESLDFFRADAAAKRIAADLRYARGRAIEGAAAQAVVFDPAADSYTLTGTRGIDRGEDDYTVSLAGEGYPADIARCAFGGSTDAAFNHHGVPADAGGVAVVSGDHRLYVIVNPAGVVSIEVEPSDSTAGGDPALVLDELINRALGR